MGGQQSKEGETLEFSKDLPNVPIQFSPTLLKTLSADPANRPVYSEREVADLLARHVAHEVDKVQRGQQFARELREEVDREQVTRRAEELLERHKAYPLPTPDPTIVAKKQAVIACYKANPDRPLDCWREAAEFRKALEDTLAR
ncbi:hypothetical protein M427DRAFT_53390 [Gonapodya prolifera JEL478]|uniref:Uncharacterized protein n=1 Tax=Gonapodya prolifera (strain JEL478) TaxID=1344416 RepID=A0A139AQ70_GONPJ|nr:hypothetical protein M427DRAFT_53390 [Gonapodya prolifera JEL478]|eukprot:KXS18911.1 hypothetical protein M427DRAFT_53390 [Gonapodya prolifera JEL478]